MDIKTLKFMSIFRTIMISFNIISLLDIMISEFSNIGQISVNRYIGIPFSVLINLTWIGLYFNGIDDAFKQPIQEKNISDIKLILKTFINKKIFGWNGACILYTLLFYALHIWIFIYELSFKWWVILIAIAEILLISIYTIGVTGVAIGCINSKKEAIKILNEGN